MKDELAILPWEYKGSAFDPSPHARASVEFDGRKCNFLFKMREGVIYFEDPRHGPMFAIPRHFERELRGEELLEAWHQEVERKNFGLFFWRPLRVLDYSTTTIVAAIVRPDFSGWTTDALHMDWLEIPKHRDGKVFDLWAGSRQRAIRRVIDRTKNVLVDRAMLESERQPLLRHWVLGSENELERVLALVMQLYVRRSGGSSSCIFDFQASNFASQGGFSSFNPLYSPDLHFSSALPSLLRVLEQQFVWVAMKWKKSRTNLADTHPLKPMKEKWGDDWRGNYRIHTPVLTVTAPVVDSLSQHEKLELLLELREWLADKVSPRQSENWLAKALD